MKKLKNDSKILFYIIFFFLSSKSAYSQVELYYEEELHSITTKSNQKIISEFLKAKNAKAIEFNSNKNSRFPFRIQHKNGHWSLYRDYSGGESAAFMADHSSKYSFLFPTKVEEDYNIAWAIKLGKIHWVSIEHEKIETKVNFDEVKTITKKDSSFNINPENKEEQMLVKVELVDIAVRKDNKWGAIEISYHEPTFYLSRYFLYDSPDEVPPPTGFASHQLAMMESIRATYNVDLLTALDENGYYLKGRSRNTHLYGLFSGEGEVFNTLPMRYDEIKRHRYPLIFEVWKDGKVGYYNSHYELVQQTEFDELEVVKIRASKKAYALKKDGYWQLYDTFEDKIIFDKKAKTLEELMELWVNRYN